MKTSKIILIGLFSSVIIWITVVFFKVHANISDFLQGAKVEIKEDKNAAVHSKNDTTIKLEDFSVAVISGNGSINIEQSDNNSVKCFSAKDKLPKIKNDTLFINVEDEYNYLYFNGLNALIISENAIAKVSDIETDTLTLKTYEQAIGKISDVKLNVLNVITQNNSIVKLSDIRGNDIETILMLQDNSQIFIDNSDNYNLSVEKGKSAKLKIGN